MIISYATQAGLTAADGQGRNSPYTMAFLKNVETKEEIGTVFRHITADVYAATDSKQLPELSLSLIGDFYLRGRPEPQISEQSVPSDAERAWAVTQNTTSIAVLEDFIRQFGTTPYGSLARARLDEMKKQAREAESAARTKEAAEAKAAEAARVKAEQEAKTAAEAARVKAEQEAKAKAEADRIRAEDAKVAAAKAAADVAQRPQNLAALMPSDQSTKSAALSPTEIVRQLQIELRRVGCFTSDIDSEWNSNTGRALELFNKHSGMNLDTKGASLDALVALRGKSSRVCPLSCQRGFHADGERCVETICRADFTMGTMAHACVCPNARTARRFPSRTKRRQPVTSPRTKPRKALRVDTRCSATGRGVASSRRAARRKRALSPVAVPE
jgi:hypothetical protein